MKISGRSGTDDPYGLEHGHGAGSNRPVPPTSGDLTGPPELSGDYLRLPPAKARRRHPTGLFVTLAVVGLLALVWVTFSAGMRCAGTSCSSGPWWVAVVAAGGLAVVGLAGWASRPPADRRTGWQAAPVLVEVLVAAGAMPVLLPVLARPQQHLLYRSGVTFAAAALLSALVAWWVAAALHGRLAGRARWHAAVVGLVAGLAAATAWAGITYSGATTASLLPGLSVLWAIALGATVLATRVTEAYRLPAVLVALAATGLSLLSAASAGSHLISAYLPEPAAPEQVEVQPPPQTTPVPTTPPEQVAPEEPVSVANAGDLCTAAAVSAEITTPVPGGHEVFTTLTVTNAGDVACRLEGWPSVRLLSDGDDLALWVHVASVDPSTGEHVEDEPVLLDPGQSGQTHLWWPGYGAAADMTADQTLQVGLGGTMLTVPLTSRQNWDVVRSAEAWVAPWQPADQG